MLKIQQLKFPFIAAVAWLIISSILLALPGSSLPSEDWLSKIAFDKWVHIGMFSIMVTLWCWGFSKTKKDKTKLSSYFITIALFCLAYGIAMEFVQEYLVENRSFDIYDIVADAVGCVAGLIFSRRRYIKK